MGVLDSTLGAIVVGGGLSCILFGVVCAQAYWYFLNYPSDRTAWKLVVAAVWVGQFLDQALILHIMYTYAVTFYDNPLAAFTGTVPISLTTHTLVAFMGGIVVKLFFAARVYIFSRGNVWITGIIVFCTLADFAMALLFTIQSYMHLSILYAPKLEPYARGALIAGAVADIVIAVALCYYLEGLRTGFQGTDYIINKLMLYAVNSGALTSLMGVAVLILFAVHPKTFEFIGAYFVLGKFYGISFLGNVNARNVVKKEKTVDVTSGSHRRISWSTYAPRSPVIGSYTSVPTPSLGQNRERLSHPYSDGSGWRNSDGEYSKASRGVHGVGRPVRVMPPTLEVGISRHSISKRDGDHGIEMTPTSAGSVTEELSWNIPSAI